MVLFSALLVISASVYQVYVGSLMIKSLKSLIVLKLWRESVNGQKGACSHSVGILN